jgi:NADPH-dependent curcumin reductase CurA
MLLEHLFTCLLGGSRLVVEESFINAGEKLVDGSEKTPDAITGVIEGTNEGYFLH